MKIRIAPDGTTIQPDNGKKLGNILRSGLPKLADSKGLHVELQLPNTHCNVGGNDPTTGQQACLVCPRNVPSFRPDPDRVDDILHILKQDIGSVPVLRISGDAEPFWQDKIFHILDSLQINRESDVKVFTTTNGTLIDNDIAKQWFDTVPKSEISFSVDATSLPTYLKLRRVSEFDRVVSNLDNYNRTRNPDHHVSVLKNNINTINIDEIEDMIRMAKNYFFHFVVLTPTSPVQRSLKEICVNEKNKNRFRDAKSRAREIADELGVNVIFAGAWPE